MSIVQDAPPPGGFPSIRIERRLPSTGPTGVAIFAGLAAIMGYGFYKVSALATPGAFQHICDHLVHAPPFAAERAAPGEEVRSKAVRGFVLTARHKNNLISIEFGWPYRFEADEILTVRRIVQPVVQAEWDLRWDLASKRAKKKPYCELRAA
jgi:hypothetical protein